MVQTCRELEIHYFKRTYILSKLKFVGACQVEVLKVKNTGTNCYNYHDCFIQQQKFNELWKNKVLTKIITRIGKCSRVLVYEYNNACYFHVNNHGLLLYFVMELWKEVFNGVAGDNELEKKKNGKNLIGVQYVTEINIHYSL